MVPSNIGINDTILLEQNARQHSLPTLYLAHNHAKRDTSRPGRVIYYVADLSKSAMQDIVELERELRVPQGSKEDAIAQGFFELLEDDIVFCRGATAPADGSKDSAVCWVTGRRIYTAEMIQRILSARDAALGPAALRSRNRPVKKDGQSVGATKFERNSRANPVHPNTRCYALANSSEPVSNIMAPAADNKKLGEVDDEILDMRGNLLRAMSALSMRSLQEGPSEILENIKINAELLNVPATGQESNIAYTAAQVNIAPAEPHDSAATLEAAMGAFGGEHRDCGDHSGYYTHMAAVSDLPESFDPGRFFILYPGVFITLSNLISINFSGLRMHGGTPPRAPPDATVEQLDQAVRVACISYPPNGQTSGNQRYALGALPGTKKKPGAVFFVPPEFVQAKELAREDRAWCVHAAYLEDGDVILPRKNQVDFFARSMYCATNFFALQLPNVFGLKVDMNQFLGSFSMPDANGVRRSLDAWPSGPGYQRSSTLSLTGRAIEDDFVNQAPVRAQKHAQWLRYSQHVASHIPYAVCNRDTSDGVFGDEIGLERGAIDDDGEDEVENLLLPDVGGRPPLNKKDGKRTSSDANASISPRVPKRPRLAENPPSKTVEMPQRAEVPSIPSTSQLMTTLRNRQSIAISESRVVPPSRPSHTSRSAIALREPTFLAELTPRLLEQELNSVRYAIISALAVGRDADERGHALALERFQLTITTAPLSIATPLSIASTWPVFLSMVSSTNRAELTLRKSRAATMLIHYTLWHWLDVLVANVVSDMLKSKGKKKVIAGMEWLSSLVDKVQEIISLKISNHTFIARAHGLNLPSEFKVELKHFPVHSSAPGKRAINATVIRILESWLQYPSQGNSRRQAWFTHVIATQLTPDLLYLDHIWTTYTTIDVNSFRSSSWKLEGFHSVRLLAHHAPQHALFDKASNSLKMVKTLVDTMDQYFAGRLEIDPSNSDAIFRDRIPSCLQVAADSRLATFVAFLRDAVAHKLSLQHTFSFPKLLQQFQTIPDKSIPFREVAPGRIRFSGPDGPFSTNTIRTTSGFFSALVFRGITFAAEFSLKGDMVFTSQSMFQAAMKEFKKEPKSFFCNSAAYGTAGRRDVKNSKEYWKMVQDGRWERFVGTRLVPFRESYNWILGQQFPQIGPLCGYLLTADLVYSEVVVPPTDDEVALVIRDLNRGATSALIDLLMVPPCESSSKTRSKPGLEETIKGFHRVKEIVQAVITPDHRQALLVDNIAIEHILCKFSRAVKKNWLQ